MNWVGGCRNRAMFKNDVRKQKEFFEKKKLQKKMKLLGVLKSPQKDNAGSMDLLTMFVVNQISSKKENSSVPMKLTHVGKFKGAQPTVRRDIQLPMSPGPPSRLCLEESQPQYNVQNFGLGRKKKSYSKYDSLKYSQLSPVLESNFSDCSNIDYQHCVPNGLSPLFSSVRYPITEKGHSPPWGAASDDTNQPQFLSFHHPRGGEDRETWTTDSHGTQQQDTLQYGNTFEQTMVQSKHHVKDEAFSAGSPVISELQWDTDLSRIQDTYVPYTDELPSGPSINLLHTRNHELSDFPSESYNAFVSDNRATFSYDESDSHSRDSSAFSIAPLLNQDRQLQSVFTEPEQVLHTHLQKTEKRGHTLPAQQCDYSFSKDNEEEDNRSFGAFEDAQTYASQDVNNCKRKIHLDGKQLLNRRIRKDLQETKGRHPDELFLSQER
ncbi:regulator of DNA class I crossover intermediates 1 [Amia ocellicauda]|uniref:regulator of DNA class I crossover intermediates 1 n=1 Tax=Amia ocellicauda TaxID=2972642 RepID=UPI003464CFB4